MDWLHDKGGSFMPHCISSVYPSWIGLMGCRCRNRVCILVLLKLQILLSKSVVLLSKVFHLLHVSLLQGVHLSLHGNDQRVIIKLLTWGTHHVCLAPFFRGTHGRYPFMVDSCSRGRFPWIMALVSLLFATIYDVVVEWEVFLRSFGERQMFFSNLVEPSYGVFFYELLHKQWWSVFVKILWCLS